MLSGAEGFACDGLRFVRLRRTALHRVATARRPFRGEEVERWGGSLGVVMPERAGLVVWGCCRLRGLIPEGTSDQASGIRGIGHQGKQTSLVPGARRSVEICRTAQGSVCCGRGHRWTRDGRKSAAIGITARDGTVRSGAAGLRVGMFTTALHGHFVPRSPFSRAKTVFQSCFMSTTVQPLATASSQPLSRRARPG